MPKPLLSSSWKFLIKGLYSLCCRQLEEDVSQVIVTEDVLQVKRDASKVQELKITQDPRLKKWSLAPIAGMDTLAMLAGIAFLPILGAWTAILFMMMLMMTCLRYLFKGLGLIVGGGKSLIIKNRP
jgi:hypothetical protein